MFTKRDVKKTTVIYADDATLSQAGDLPISGVHRGKDAIEALEYDLEYTNRQGKTFQNSGASIGRARRGKIVDSKEFIFDAGVSKKAWGNP